MLINDKICPNKSINDDLAGCWFAINKVEIILNINCKQKYVNIIKARIDKSVFWLSDIFRSEFQLIK